MTKNFEELKRLFDEECTIVETWMKSLSQQRLTRPPAYVLVSMLQGTTHSEADMIVYEMGKLLATLRYENTIDAATVYKTLVPIDSKS